MSRAIYTVERDGEIIARRESLLWVRLAEPGVYLVCGEEDGEGRYRRRRDIPRPRVSDFARETDGKT